MTTESDPTDASDASLDLNDGRRLPAIGLGVYKMSDEEAAEMVHTALQSGYRSVDTAAMYGNERGVGRALSRSYLPRRDTFIATKVRFEDNGYDETLRAFEESAARLGTDYVDLYLIHWPAPLRDRYVDAWRALIRLRDEGRVLSIGVCNFHPQHLDRVLAETGVVPAVNQVELHPVFPQRALREENTRRGIVTQAWSPLARGRLLGDSRLLTLARKHGVTPAQIVLRWHLENGVAVVPKSSDPSRIRQNMDLFRFRLDAADKILIAAMETGERTGVDPNDRN